MAEPWGSGLTSASFVGLSYLSSTNQLLAALMSGSGTGEVVNFKTTDADNIAWDAANNTFGFVAGTSGLDNLHMTGAVASVDQVAVALWEVTNSEFEFSTVPENGLLLIVASMVWMKLKRKHATSFDLDR